MLETKLELAVKQLLNNYNPRKKQMLLQSLGEILLKISYFQIFMENYPDLGPLIYPNLIKSLNFKTYKEKTIIWDYNDPVDGVYIIISGEVKIFAQPNKINLIRCKNIKKNKEISIKNLNNNIIKKILSTKSNNIPLSKLYQFPYNLLKTRPKIINSDLGKRKRLVLAKRNKPDRIQKCPSAKYLNNFNLNMNDYQNISLQEQQVSLTDKNYIYREPEESRKLDYIEHFGKMIGEDAMLKELKYRKYACETSTRCILAFLSEKNYHIFFDNIKNTNRGKIISFLYKVNYFNNKNDFIHKLSRLIKIKICKKGNFIYEKNMPFLNMYLLKSGNVAINMMKISKYKSNLNSELFMNSYRDIKKNKSLNDINEINSEKNFNHFTKERSFELSGEYYENKLFTLITLEKGEILGNIEYYLDLKKYMFSAKCLTDVELYEINAKSFRKIIKPYNIDFFENKTKQQIKYFSNKIREIYLREHKNDNHEYKSKNKFMKLYCQKHPLSALKIEEKYINNEKYPLPINIKYESKNFKKTKISPYYMYELANALMNYQNKNKKNIFITNNIDFTNSLLNNTFKKSFSFKNGNQMNSKDELISLANIIKFSNKGTSIMKKRRKSDYLEKFLKQINKLSHHKSKNPNCYSVDSRLNNYERRNKIDIDNNKLYNQKNSKKLYHNIFNLKCIQNKNKSVDFINTLIENFKIVDKENLKKPKPKPKVKKVIVEKKKEIGTLISFDGYQVYLKKNKKSIDNSKYS